MDLVIEVEGEERPGAELDSLLSKLQDRDELADAEIDPRVNVPADGAMGPFTDALLIAFGSGGIATGLVECVCAWLRSRKTAVTVKLSRPDGTQVEISVDNAHDPAFVAGLARELAGTR
jgi:hypothetical protein